jgi:integrase/recombinase XerD
MLTNLAEAVAGVRTDEDLIEAWLHGRPEATRQSYGHAVASLRRHVPKPLGAICSGDLVAWYWALEGSDGTRTTRMFAIKSLFAFGFRAGVLPTDAGRPIRVGARPVRRPERVVERDLIEELLRKCPLGRNHALLLFLRDTGARPCEVTRLRFCDLRLDRVVLTGKRRKKREVPVQSDLLIELRALRREEDGESAVVFRSFRNRPMSTRTLWYVFKSLVDDLIAEDFPPYALRHSFATHMIEDGVPVHVVQKLLGHASLETTSVYVHPPASVEGDLARRRSPRFTRERIAVAIRVQLDTLQGIAAGW